MVATNKEPPIYISERHPYHTSISTEIPNTALHRKLWSFTNNWLYKRSSIKGIRFEILFAPFSFVSKSCLGSDTQLCTKRGVPTVSRLEGISEVDKTT